MPQCDHYTAVLYFTQSLFILSMPSFQTPTSTMAAGGPVRRKRQPTLIESVLGMFVGIALVLGSPVAMWSAASQHTAKDFASGTVVAPASNETGYVIVSGTPKYADKKGGEACYRDNCAFQTESRQELVTKTALECGDNVQPSETVRILGQNGVECDDNNNCVPCYNIERDTWEEQSSVVTTYPVVVGSYTVNPSEKAIYFDTAEDTVDQGISKATGRKMRSVYKSFVMPSTLLVAGESDGDQIVMPEKLAYVLSSYDQAATLEKLKARDEANKWALRVVAFAMLAAGFAMIFGPLKWLGRQFRVIPVLGPIISEGSGLVIGLVSVVLAIPIWIVLLLLVAVLKTWWLALIVLLTLIAFIVFASKKNA